MTAPGGAGDPDGSLGHLFTHAPCGLLAMDMDGTIRVANDEILAISGRARGDLVGALRFQDLLASAGATLYETHMAPMLELHGSVRELAVELVRPDGTRRPVLVTATVHPDGSGGRVIEAVVLDATERHRHERELLVSNRRVERLQRLATRFAASLDTRGVAEAALEEIVDGIKADLGVVSLLRRESSLDARAVRLDSPGASAAWTTLVAEEGSAAQGILAMGEPVFVEDDDGRALGLPDLGGPDSRSSRVAVLPLVVDDHPLGLLCLASRTRVRFDSDERLFLAAFARACAQALDRARMHDITAEAARRMELLSALGRHLNEPLAFADRAQRLVDLLVPDHADFATVEVIERGPRPVAARHVDPAMLDPLIALRTKARVTAERDHSLARARATLEPQLIAEIPASTYADYDLQEDELALLERLAPRSYVGLPMQARGKLVGTLMLVMSDSPRHYAADDLGFFVDVAERAALALENARLYEQEQELSLRLQRSFLPQSLPEDPRVRLNAVYRPTTESLEIGGDWYDAFLIDQTRLGLVVGDVVGHNEDAALVMGRLSTALRAFALEGQGPASTVARLSHFAGTTPGALCTTVCYAELALDTGTVTYACAGHPPPLYREPGGRWTAAWDGRSPALGITPTVAPTQATLTLEAGAVLMLFTDGLIERRGVPIDESIDGLVGEVASLPSPVTDGTLSALVDTLLADSGAQDDLCVLTLSVLAAPLLGDG